MDPSDERHIERFVRDPASMSDERRSEAERLIEENEGARTYAEFLRGFYDRLGDEPLETASGRVEKFVNGLFQKELFQKEGESVVSLRPFRPPREARPTILAAETSTKESRLPSNERRFSVLATLGAETEDLVVRALKDEDTRQGRLYVLSESPEKRAHALVSFPKFGLDLVTDEEGLCTFELPAEVDLEQWAGAQAVVRRPVAMRAVGPGEKVTMNLPTGDTLLGRREGETLRVVLEPYGPEETASHLTVTTPNCSARLFRLGASSLLERGISPEAPLLLRVYE